MTTEHEKSDDRVVPEGRRKAVPTAFRIGGTQGGKAVTATEQDVQLRLFPATAEKPRREKSRVDTNARAVGDLSPSARRKGPKAGETIWRARPAMTMEEVASEGNLLRSFKKVADNKGAAGPDRESIGDVEGHLASLIPGLSKALIDGTYTPGEIRRVWIPKPDGSQRGLGIPNVVDRMVQQAFLEVLDPHYDETFHDSSHGFRRGRSCHTAIALAKEHMESGASWVVDIDLEKFFDRVNHQRLLSRLEQTIKDPRIIGTIRKMLKAKTVMPDGVVVSTDEGTPQGGPLSPLLSNIVLDELDRELERRGLRFVRYADDCNIYVGSERAGRRVMAGIRSFIERKLKLRVNEKKSEVARPVERHFLGFRLDTNDLGETEVLLSKRTEERARDKLAEMTPRNWGDSVPKCIEKLNQYLAGWIGFFVIATEAAAKSIQRVESHARRRLRAIYVKQWKRRRTMTRKLIASGLKAKRVYADIYGGSDSPWRLSHTLSVDRMLNNAQFSRLGLFSIVQHWRSDLARRSVTAPVQLALSLG